jgi:hypothetical protein
VDQVLKQSEVNLTAESERAKNQQRYAEETAERATHERALGDLALARERDQVQQLAIAVR